MGRRFLRSREINRGCYHVPDIMDGQRRVFQGEPGLPETPWDNALEALEWGKVVSRLCRHASSEPGRERCAEILPGTDLDAIRISLEENRDGRRMLIGEGALPLEGLKEITPAVEKAVKGAPLSPAELLLVGSTARAGERTRRFFEDRRGKYPRLAHHANKLPPLPAPGGLGAGAAARRQPPREAGGRVPPPPPFRPPHPGRVRHRPLGAARDPLPDRGQGAFPRDRPRHLAKRPDRILRTGGARLPEQRDQDGRDR